MGRRRIDWVQAGLLLAAILGAAMHIESRLTRIEAHLEMQYRDNAELKARLERIEAQRRR